MLLYKDQKHRDKVVARCLVRMNLKTVMKSLRLITPGSQIITGQFKTY
jgi:hypothetical protein